MQEERWIKHYCNYHKILLVGEGDFSFSACLANAFGSATNMVSTSLDQKAMVVKKHSTAEGNLRTLKTLNCTIVHEVNAHSMSTHSVLRKMKFDRVVFNFPHAGSLYSCIIEEDRIQIMLHREVVRGFFRSARNMLTSTGEIHVTHKTGYPFSAWRIEVLAQEAGLRLVQQVDFSKHDYPGYHNKKGYGSKSNKTFRVGLCSTFKFAL